MWKKPLIIFTALLAITGIATPYLVGMEAEQRVKHLDQNLPNLGTWKAEGTDYQRGWFKSQAQTKFVAPSQQLVLEHNIKHSILPFQSTKVETILTADQQTQDLLSYIFNQKQPLIVQTELNLNSGKSILYIAPFSIREQENVFIWHGLQGQLNFSLDGKEWANQIIIPQIAMRTEHGSIQLREIKFNADMKQIERNANLIINNISIISQHYADKITLEQLELHLDSKLSAELLNLTAKLQAKSINFGHENYAPQYINSEINNLHLPTLQAWRNDLQQISAYNAQQQSLMRAQLLLQYGIELLKQYPELNINSIELQTPHGKLTGNMQLRLLASPEAAAAGNDIFGLFNLLSRTEGNVDLSIPSQLIASMPITDWLSDKKLLIKSESVYLVKLKLANGVINTGTNRIPLLQLLW